MFRLQLCASALLVLFGCTPTTRVADDPDAMLPAYPAQIFSFEHSENFPMQAAGFERGSLFAFEPGGKHVGISYSRMTPEEQQIATFYLMPHNSEELELERLFLDSAAAVVMRFPDATVLAEEDFSVEKHGIWHPAKRVSFEFSNPAEETRQRLYSELILVSHNRHYVKLRITSPADQILSTAKKSIELLNAVNWSY